MDITLIQIKKGCNEELNSFKQDIINYLATKKYSSKSITLLTTLRLINNELESRQKPKQSVKVINKYRQIIKSKDENFIATNKKKDTLINDLDFIVSCSKKNSSSSLSSDISLACTRCDTISLEEEKVPNFLQDMPNYLGKKRKSTTDDADLIKAFDDSLNSKKTNIFDNFTDEFTLLRCIKNVNSSKSVCFSSKEYDSTNCGTTRNSRLNSYYNHSLDLSTKDNSPYSGKCIALDLNEENSNKINAFDTDSSDCNELIKIGSCRKNSKKSKEMEIFLCSLDIEETDSFFSL